MNWRNILERAAWTAVQAALAAIPVAQAAAVIAGGSIDALAQIGLAALGAGVAALLSFVKTISQERLAVITAGKLLEAAEEADADVIIMEAHGDL